jgi:hypothetical protein
MYLALNKWEDDNNIMDELQGTGKEAVIYCFLFLFQHLTDESKENY